MSNSSVDTYGYLYKRSFDPSSTSLNLLMEDDDSGSSEQFKLTAFLRPSITYVLVVTTSSPYVTGQFSIIASGTSSINLVRVPVHRTTTTLPVIQSNYHGDLDRSSSMYCPNSCYGSNHYYQAVMISVEEVGHYNFRSRSDFDAYGALYIDSFDPSKHSINMLVDDDDSAGDREFDLTVALQPQKTYILVVTTYLSNEMGNFQIIASGPASVEFVRVINPSTSSTTMTTREMKSKYSVTISLETFLHFLAIPSSVQSTYSSAWTIESSTYCRTSCQESSHYYYEAIEVRVDTHGIFSLISKSNVDTYSYLYNSSFDPSSPSLNLLLQDDDDGTNNGQFKLTFSLQSDSTYILVSTTFYPNTTGSFNISASGPGSVTFSPYITVKTLSSDDEY